MLRAFVILALLLIRIEIVSAQVPAVVSGNGSPAKPSATVMANVAATGITIPSNFVGISGEVGDLIFGYYQGTTGNAASFISLVQLLGSQGVLRIGGSTSDTASAPALTQAIVTKLGQFVTGLGTGWTLIYGLDLFANDSASATTQAGYLATTFGAANVTVQFGNEPDGYLSIANYQTRWNAYYTAVNGTVPSLKYAAWDASSFCCDVTAASGLTPGTTGFSLITNHYYDSQYVTSPTLSKVLTDATIVCNVSSGPTCAFNQLIGKTSGVALRLTESNSIGGGGQQGITDRMGNSAWYLDEAIALASGGWTGINTHGSFTQLGHQAYYNPVIQLGDSNFGPGPIFYGLYLFSKIQGQQIIASSIGGNANLNAIATKGGNGNANIIAVNNDVNNSVAVMPAQSAAWTTATVLQIKGAAGCTEANPTIGGAQIGESGAWSGGSMTISKGASVVLGPCESALIQIQP